jgi:hypothetical protein
MKISHDYLLSIYEIEGFQHKGTQHYRENGLVNESSNVTFMVTFFPHNIQFKIYSFMILKYQSHG